QGFSAARFRRHHRRRHNICRRKRRRLYRRGTARWLAILIIILSLAASALCLWVSEISYSFFHYVDCTAPDRLDFSNEITRLSTLVAWRTVYYQTAWWFSMIAIPLFF